MKKEALWWAVGAGIAFVLAMAGVSWSDFVRFKAAVLVPIVAVAAIAMAVAAAVYRRPFSPRRMLIVGSGIGALVLLAEVATGPRDPLAAIAGSTVAAASGAAIYWAAYSPSRREGVRGE